MGNRKSKEVEDKALSPYSSWGQSLDNLLCGEGKICDERWTPVSLRSRDGSPYRGRSRADSYYQQRRHSYGFEDDYLEDETGLKAVKSARRRSSEVFTREGTKRRGSVIKVQPLPRTAGRLKKSAWGYDEYESELGSIRPISADEVIAPVHLPGKHPRYGTSSVKAKVTRKKAKKKVKKRAKTADDFASPYDLPSTSSDPINLYINSGRNSLDTNHVEMAKKGVYGKVSNIGPRSYSDLRKERTRSLDRNRNRTRRSDNTPSFRSPPPGSDSMSSGSTGRRIVPPRKAPPDTAPPVPFRVVHAPDDILAYRRMPTADALSFSISR